MVSKLDTKDAALTGAASKNTHQSNICIIEVKRMRLRIYQPDNGYASAAVHVSFNETPVGMLGPGNMIDVTIQHDEDYPYKIIATCGMFHAVAYGHRDAALQVQWNARDHKMVLKSVDAGADPYLVGSKQKQVYPL